MDRDLIFICRKLTLKFIYLGPSARPGKYFAKIERSEFTLAVQIAAIIFFLTKLISYQPSVIMQEAHKNSPNM